MTLWIYVDRDKIMFETHKKTVGHAMQNSTGCGVDGQRGGGGGCGGDSALVSVPQILL